MNELSEKYDLPEDFAVSVDDYIKNRTVITNRSELISFWQKALDARTQHPEMQESIAEWAVSCAAPSPLIKDNDILDQIHGTFGALEVYSLENDKLWGEIEELLAEAAKV